MPPTRSLVHEPESSSRAPSAGDDEPSYELPPHLDTTAAHLVALGTRSDHIGELLRLLSASVRRSLAVVGPDGAPLATALIDAAGAEAAIAALSASERGAPTLAPAGWELVSLRVQHETLGFLLVGADPPMEPGERALVALARSLLADQLRRAAMAARLLDERRSALKRRLVGDGHPTLGALRAESERAQMALADRYWPAVLSFDAAEQRPDLLADMEALLERHGAEHLLVRHDARTVVLLIACTGPTAAQGARARTLTEQVVALACGRLHGGHVHAILAKAPVATADATGRVEELHRLSRGLERRHALAGRRVHAESALAFLHLLDAADRDRAATFVIGEIGPLLSYDRAHGAHLTDLLEIALDLPNRADAARAAYMHRNTFRRHLKQATELIDRDLSDPDARLAVHVALRLTNLLGVGRDTPTSAAGRPREPDPVRPAPGRLTTPRRGSETP